MKKITAILLVIAALAFLAACEPIDVNPGKTAKNNETAKVPLEELTSEKVGIVIEVKDFGKMKLELYPKLAPITVENFLSYVDSGYYEGVTFHRIMKGFMIQGGAGGATNAAIKGEFSENGVYNPLSHQYGVISMARTTVKDSATSQFFICNADASASLDGKYAAFGKLVEGSDVLDAISSVEVTASERGEMSVPVTPVIIEKIYRAE